MNKQSESTPIVHHIVRDYLARQAMHRGYIPWDPEKQAWKYFIRHFGEASTQEEVAFYVKELPLVVPGLVVLDSGYRHIWFTWSREAMWARIQEVFKQYGVADPRLAYMTCSGTYERKQCSLGIVMPEARGIMGAGCFSSYTHYGLQQMETGFSHRIREPNRGGPDAIPFSEQRCRSG